VKVELGGVFKKGKISGYFRTEFKGDEIMFQDDIYIEFVFQIGENLIFF
jgi:hypothetical protein